MNAWDILLVGGIGLALAFAIRRCILNRGKGGCCGSCAECRYKCRG